MNKLVSIGVPSYNRPVTLERTLFSIVNQTYKNLEIIVSDNCSTNSEVEVIIDKYKSDIRVKYFRQIENKGPIYNFNYLLEKVTGDYFMRIGDDDWLDLDYVEKCLTFLEENLDYSSAYGQARVYDLKGDFVMLDAEIDMTHTSCIDRNLYYINRVQFNSCYFGLMRKSCLPFAISKNLFGMDWLIISRLLCLGKLKMIETTHSNISLGGDSHSLDHLTKAYGMSRFTRSFPYLALGRNIFCDILYGSSAYKSLNLLDRCSMAAKCFLIVFKRFNVKREVNVENVKKYLK